MNRYASLTRKELEALLAEAEVLLSKDEVADTQRLLHELQLHKIELEIQNQDLRESQQALEEARDRYAKLYDFAPVGYLTLDKQGLVLDLNLTAAAMLGRERSRILNTPLATLFASGSRQALFRHLRQVFDTGDDTLQALGLPTGAQGEVREIRLDSQLLQDAASGPSCLTTMIDVSEQMRLERDQQQAAQQRLVQEQALRDTLIREVHHRIKNHLQGLMGLLRNLQYREADPDSIVEKAVAQVFTISTVYGIQSRMGEKRVRFSELLTACLELYRRTHAIEVTLRLPEGVDESLEQEKAVPLALVINEMITNATKHSPKSDAPEPVEIVMQGDDASISLHVSNPSDGLPSGLDLNRGTALGSGLQLAKMLLPSPGARLTLSEERGRVVAELILEPPVLRSNTHDEAQN